MTPPGSEENVGRPSSSAARGPRRLQAVESEAGAEPAPRAPECPPHNLPLELSSFVGRGQEITEIKRMLLETRRLTSSSLLRCTTTRVAAGDAVSVAARFQ